MAPSLRQSGENFHKILTFMNELDQPPELVANTKLTMQLENGSRIISLPGSESTVRGFSGPGLIIEDESSRCDDALYEALRPMLASNPRGRLILASTPWGQRGHFFKTWTEDVGNWLRIKVVASENPKIDPTFLEEERTALGP